MIYEKDKYYLSGYDNDVYILNILNGHYFCVEFSNNHQSYSLEVYTEDELKEYFSVDGSECCCDFMDTFKK